MKKQILVMGAGAVGLVYGKHFADGGHDVTFYVREKYRAEMVNGSVLYHINSDKKLKRPIRFSNYKVVTTFEEIGQNKYDEVYITFSSTAVLKFDFITFKQHLQNEPTIVMLQASTDDRVLLLQHFEEEQLVQGMITLISYTAPLATETVSVPGIAYWLPPLVPMPVSGPQKRRDAVIQSFKSGKIRAKSSKSVQNEALYPSAFLGTFLTALEYKNWKFKDLGSDKSTLRDLNLAVGEVFNALEKQFEIKKPAALGLITKPFVTKIALKVAQKVMPMDLETYLEYHFKKVNDQTKMYMRNYQAMAEQNGSAYKTIAKLNQQVLNA